MIAHPTAPAAKIDETVAGIVLVGPPAAGKSTARNLLQDMGVETVDVTDAERENEDGCPEWITRCCSTAEKASRSIPVCAIEGLQSDEEVDWFADLLDKDVLVVRVDTHSEADRMERYIDRELGADQAVVTGNEIRQLRDEFYRREYDEVHFVDHHVSIYNDDSVRITKLATRLQGVVQAISNEEITEDMLGVR